MKRRYLFILGLLSAGAIVWLAGWLHAAVAGSAQARLAAAQSPRLSAAEARLAGLAQLQPLVTAVAVADVRDVAVGWNADRTQIETTVRLGIVEVLVGEVPAEITITQPGGEIDGLALAVSHTARWTPGERALVSLATRDGRYYLVGGERGRFALDGRRVPELNLSVEDVAEVTRTGTVSAGARAVAAAAPPNSLRAEGARLGFSWSANSFPIPYLINPANGPSGVSRDGFESSIARAFSSWRRVSGEGVRWRATGTTSLSGSRNDGLNVVYWEPIDTPGVLGYTLCWYTTGDGRVLDCDVQLDPGEFTWAVLDQPGGQAVDLESVALHEFGHFIGLAHSTDPGAVMYPSITLGAINRTPNDDDIGLVASVYRPSVEATPTATPAVPATATPAAPATATPTAGAGFAAYLPALLRASGVAAGASREATAAPTATASPGNRPVVTEIRPSQGPTSAPLAVTIRGAAFRAGAQATLLIRVTRVGLGVQSAPVNYQFELTDEAVQDPFTLRGTVPAGLPAGSYDVKVTNPEGTTSALLGAFTVTGQGPIVTGIQPPQGVDQVPNDVMIAGYNFQDGVTVALRQVTTTVVLTETRRVDENRVQAIVPAGLPPGSYDVILQNPGVDQAGGLAGAYTVELPINDDLYIAADDIWIDPPAVRNGDRVQLGVNLHRRGGKRTFAGVPIRFYLGDPHLPGSLLIGEATSQPLPPRTDQEPVYLAWDVGNQEGPAEIYALVDPDNTLAETTKANNVAVRQLILLPKARDDRPPDLTNLEVNQGAGQTVLPEVPVEVTASDPGGGSGVTSMYLIEREFNASAQAWVPVSTTGWISYTSPYTLTLTPRAGIRYIRAYVADRAGNVSLNLARQAVNYLPPTNTLKLNQVRVYRRFLTAGQSLSAQLETVQGDADLFVWDPSGNSVLVRNAGGIGLDEGVVTAAVDGVYQFEVTGYEDNTTYRLTLSPGGGGSTAPSDTKPAPAGPVVPVGNVPDERSALPGAPLSSLP